MALEVGVVEVFQWNDAYSVGVPHLDQEHKTILLIINLLIEHHSDGPDPDFLQDVLTDLGAYAARHFQHEESLLEACGYPDLAAHKREHQAFRQEIDAHRSLLTASPMGQNVVPEDLYRFLVEWWNDHILEADRKYRTHLA